MVTCDHRSSFRQRNVLYTLYFDRKYFIFILQEKKLVLRSKAQHVDVLLTLGCCTFDKVVIETEKLDRN